MGKKLFATACDSIIICQELLENKREKVLSQEGVESDCSPKSKYKWCKNI